MISEERKYARLAYPRHDQRLLRSSLLAQAGKWKDKNDMKIMIKNVKRKENGGNMRKIENQEK